MKVYFIRHGLTDSLVLGTAQQNDEPLNQTGFDQAKKIAQNFLKTGIGLVISSPYTRSLQTAKTISVNVTISDLFKEVVKPTEIIGKPKDSLEVQEILKKIEQRYFTDPSWHYSDEENFEDVKKRGLAALEYLQTLPYENIIVVSHGRFISRLIGLMIFNNDYSVESFLKIKNFFHIDNGGITTCEYLNNQWSIRCLNCCSGCK